LCRQRLARIAEQRVRLRRPEIPRIDLDEHPAVALVEALFGYARTAPFDGRADASKSPFGKLANRVLFSRRQDIIVWFWLLHDEPHSFDIVSRVTPVAHGG
jgi:hypothetical protein